MTVFTFNTSHIIDPSRDTISNPNFRREIAKSLPFRAPSPRHLSIFHHFSRPGDDADFLRNDFAVFSSQMSDFIRPKLRFQRE